ncbi:MAG: glutamyl-tRNA reductase [Armatimonadota bacterium]|nr:glutamyl-tRNA reductase [Armatimonadota bacterium]MDR7439062.1 glutamyl-tRNA reductase [Armatimonadota bacterium]MDR7563001.1 glutamyl-tRNA reductase [Armatimonadota bacterium]MDR7567926.1 glutamyl-tRNA reductase [Armatimonadota bacterium]MDR7600845.1 glutamyl-tRNA reductase [Armatimonadota bacterium]
MDLLAVGLSHHTAPVEVRERVAFLPAKLASAVALLRQHKGVQEAALLSTCNRTEAYVAAVEGEAGRESVLAFWSAYHGVPRETFAPYVYVYRGAEAARHLFRVAGGLDSMIVGEAQILGQVREAFGRAQEGGGIGPVLSRLFRQAIAAGRRVRRETGIGRGAVSVPGAALAVAREVCGDLRGRRVLVLGSGEMARLLVRNLVEAGCTAVMVCNRTLEHAEALAAAFRARTVRFDELGSALHEADILVTSTGAPHVVVEASLVAEVMQKRTVPLLILDIAVPRDVDPAVRSLPGVHLVNIDDLEAAGQKVLWERRGDVERAEAIVAEEVEKFETWYRSLGVVPLIRALRHRAEAVLEEEWARLRPQLAHLPAEHQEAVRQSLRTAINRLLHRSIVRLKAMAAEQDPALVDAARVLLDLEDVASS